MPLHVDLTLAVNYLPACACLGKVLVFMLAVAIIPPGREVDGLVIIAAMLYMDRMVTRNIIFDANAILLAIFFANVHAGIRASSSQLAYRVLVDCMFLCWAAGSLVLLGEPSMVKKVVERKPEAARLVPVVLMLVIVVAMTHVHEPLEPGGVRCFRAVAFTLLSFAWIYIVGVHATTGIEYLKENSCQFVARLSPVLYASQWVAALFTVGAVAAFGAQYMRLIRVNAPHAASMMMTHPTPTPVMNKTNAMDAPSPSSSSTPDDAIMAQLDDAELFRLARMQATRKLETILEVT